mgnify:CR=1 FL=1
MIIYILFFGNGIVKIIACPSTRQAQFRSGGQWRCPSLLPQRLAHSAFHNGTHSVAAIDNSKKKSTTKKAACCRCIQKTFGITPKNIINYISSRCLQAPLQRPRTPRSLKLPSERPTWKKSKSTSLRPNHPPSEPSEPSRRASLCLQRLRATTRRTMTVKEERANLKRPDRSTQYGLAICHSTSRRRSFVNG